MLTAIDETSTETSDTQSTTLVDLAISIKELKVCLSEVCTNVQAIRSDISTFKSKLLKIESEMETINTTLVTVSKRTDIIQAAQRQDRDRIARNEKEFTNLTKFLAEIEDRNRRSNLRLVNLPESAEGGNAIAFLQTNLPKWFPSLADRGPIEIERAHRIYGPKTQNGSGQGKPRTFIFKLLSYMDRRAILQAYREPGANPIYGQTRLLFSLTTQDIHRSAAKPLPHTWPFFVRRLFHTSCCTLPP